MSALQEAIDYFRRVGMHTRVTALEEESRRQDAAQRTLMAMGYVWSGGEYYKPPVVQPKIIPGTITGDDDNPIFVPGG